MPSPQSPPIRGRRCPRGIVALAMSILCSALAASPPPLDAEETWLADDPRVELVARALEGPVAIAPAEDGRVYVAERRSGRIRVIVDGVLRDEPVVTLDGIASGERGLLGLAAATGPSGLPVLYALHTPTSRRARIVRVEVDAKGGARVDTVLDDIPTAATRTGGALALGPDGHLYFSVGDLGDPQGTLPEGSETGRIHRIAVDGSIPDDNPDPESTVFCRGLRNCFGITFAPEDRPGVLYLTDNGPTEDDEVNRAEAGDHLGWPDVTGTSERTDRIDPIRAWGPTTAPVGIALAPDGPIVPEDYRGDLFFGEYVTGRIIRLSLDPEGITVEDDEVFIDRGPAPVYALAFGPDGSLWCTAGDSVLRIRLGAEESRWIRGDVDGDRRVAQGDVAALLAHLHGGAHLPCPASADIDANGVLDGADVVTLLQFLGGEIEELPAPFPACDTAPTGGLPCPRHPACPD